MNTTSPRKVIVVDDEHEVVDLICDLLKMHHYEAIATTQWTEALDALEHEHPDLLLLDLNMPTIDGRALLRFVREQGYDLPVIVVSGYITDEIRKELRTMGVQAFVDKPFALMTLTAEIAAVLGDSQPAEAQTSEAVVEASEEISEPAASISSSPSSPPPLQITEPAIPADHSPGILTPRPRRQRTHAPSPRINSPRMFKRNVTILAVLALICILVAGFMVIASQQTTKQARSPEELLRER